MICAKSHEYEFVVTTTFEISCVAQNYYCCASLLLPCLVVRTSRTTRKKDKEAVPFPCQRTWSGSFFLPFLRREHSLSQPSTNERETTHC